MINSTKLKRLLAALLSTAMLPITGALADSDISAITFDDAPTNSIVGGILVNGTDNARVAEDGRNNKSFLVPTSYVGTTVETTVPKNLQGKQLVYRFDLKYEKAFSALDVKVKTTQNGYISIFSVDESGKICTHDKKRIGSIGFGRYSSIVIVPDNNRGCYSVYLNGKSVLGDWSLAELAGTEITGLSFVFSETNVEGSGAYLDNIAVRSGDRCIKDKELPRTSYSDEEYEFNEIDEKTKLTEVFINESFEDPSSYTVALIPKENDIKFTEVNGNGAVRITKLPVNADLFWQGLMKRSVKNMVLSVDMCYEEAPIDGVLYLLRDANSSASLISTSPISVDKSGTIKVGGIGTIKMKKGEWYNLAMVMNLKEHKYSFYVNGSQLTANGSLPSNFDYLSEWRMYFGPSAQNGSWLIDNVRIYGGKEIRDISNEEIKETSRYTDDIPALLKGRNALSMYSNYMFKGNAKLKADSECKIIDGSEFIPATVIKDAFGIDVQEGAGRIKIGARAVFDISSNETKVDNKTVQLNNQPIIENGSVYIPVQLLTDYSVADTYFYNDKHGLLLQTESELDLEDGDPKVSEANRYLFFDRDKSDTLKEKFLAKNGTGDQSHPRLFGKAEDFEALKKEIETNEIKKEWHSAIMARADELAEKPLPVYTIKDGRLLDVSNDFEERMIYLSYAYKMTGDAGYGEIIWKNIEAVCNFTDWHPDHTLDIAGMCQGVALGYDWAYDYFSDEQRKFILEKSKLLGLAPARANYYGKAMYSSTFWAATDTNWGMWINSAVAMLAMSTAENDIDYNMDVLYNALRSVEYPWYEIAPNGAWHEGASYWSVVISYAARLLSCYNTTFGESFCGEKYKGLEDLGLFTVYLSSPDGVVNNFHDSYEGKVSSMGQTYLASRFSNNTIMQSRLSAIKRDNAIPEPAELLWFNKSLANAGKGIDLVKYYDGVEAVTMMGDATDPNAAWLSFHGGSTSGAHNHVDEGTFVYNIGGLRWFVDIGSEPMSYLTDADNPSIKAGYDSKYFYRRKAEGHNSVVINPDAELEMDLNAFARISKPVATENGAYSTIDLTDHYAKNVRSYIRGYKLSEGMRAFTLRDEIELKNDNSELYWFLHTKGKIKIIDNSTALIYYGGKQLKVSVNVDVSDYELKVMEAKKLPTSVQFEETPNDAYSKLAIHFNASGKVNITARMTLLGEAASDVPVDDTPIAQWSAVSTPAAPSKESKARLSSLMLDGTNVYGFEKDKFQYSYMLVDGDKMPEITAESENRYEVEYYEDHIQRTNALIKVYDDNGMYTTYIITFEPYTPQYIGEYERCYVAGAEASSIPEDYNRPEHSFDGNQNTRWSGQGDGEWLVHDFGSIQTFDAVGVALWKGAERVFKYDILVSKDGINFTPVLTGVESSGKTEGLEIKELPSPVEARYIKYLGHGNSTNTWNNVIELAALRKR